MHRHFSSRLRRRATTATVRQNAFLLLASAALVTLCATPLRAQEASALRLAVTYNTARGDTVSNGSFWMQGGSIELEGRLYRGLGAVAEVAGTHAGNIRSSGAGLALVTATLGPRYTRAFAHRRYEVFAQALAGEAFGFNSIFPSTSGAIGSDSSLALKIGGGMNIALSPHLALRAFQANWLRTQLPNTTTNVQNTLDLGAGVVFCFR